MNFNYKIWGLTLSIVAISWGCKQGSAAKEAPESTSVSSQTESIEKDAQSLVIEAQSEPDTLKGSLKARARGKIGAANITINYHSPAVRGRIVWGGLVPYDQVWITGAHIATSLATDQPISIGDKTIPAGKYAIFTIPTKEKWTVIINADWEQHLADKYDLKKDIVRLQIKPQSLEQHQERLRYVVLSNSDNKGEITISWEKQQLVIPVKLEISTRNR